MKLYHGTRLSLLNTILRGGLEPRGQKRKGTWKHAPSCRHAVYFTNAYAPYFATMAARTNDKQALVIEVDTDSPVIKHNRLLPDEDAVEQLLRGKDNIPGTIQNRGRYYRNRLHVFNDLAWWERSLNALGTCAYIGTVPPAAITRVAIIPTNYLLMWDATITLTNFRLLGDIYKAQTERMFGGAPTLVPQFGRWDWRIPMDHEVYLVRDGKLGHKQLVQLPDERDNQLKRLLSNVGKEQLGKTP